MICRVCREVREDLPSLRAHYRTKAHYAACIEQAKHRVVLEHLREVEADLNLEELEFEMNFGESESKQRGE